MNEFLVVTFNSIVWNPIDIFREGRKDAQKNPLKSLTFFKLPLTPLPLGGRTIGICWTVQQRGENQKNAINI